MFDSATQAFLRSTERIVERVPCEKGCGCDHRVVPCLGGFLGVCDCGRGCEEMRLPPVDVKVWKLSLDSLGHQIAKAMGCRPNLVELGLPRTKQVASFGDKSLPLILTIQSSQRDFVSIVEQLITQVPGRFILLAPTNRFAGDDSRTLLRQVKAGFLDFESILRLWPNGTIAANKSAEKLLSSCCQPISGPANEDEVGRMGQVVDDIHKKISTVELVVGEMLRKVNESQTPLITPTESINRTTAAAGEIKGTAVLPSPKYLLRRGVGLWRVVFDGMEGEIKSGRGISLVAYLLFNPPLGGLHGTELAKLAFGREVMQEASLGAEGDSTGQLIWKRAKECMVVLQDPDASAIEKAEAKEELEQLADALKMVGTNSEGGADKQVRAVRRAIDRLIDNLREAKDQKNDPNLALRALGEHLHKYLWIPSARFSGNRHSRTRADVAGKFTYERPDGIIWEG
jgi:hypothetical protein